MLSLRRADHSVVGPIKRGVSNESDRTHVSGGHDPASGEAPQEKKKPP